MKRTSFSEMSCPIARSLDLIGEWWTPLILREVFYGNRRFEGMLEALGISRNVLTDRLSTLTENQILEKRLYQTNPERHEYFLTERGQEIIPILVVLMKWGNRWIFGKEVAEVLRHDCGQPADPQIVCKCCNREITATNIYLRQEPR